MENIKLDVVDLMVHLHSSVDSIHRSMRALSDTSAHDTEIARLEEECERRVEKLGREHERLKRQIEEGRRRKEEDIRERRVREEMEIIERRRREDEERRRRLEREEEQREREKREEDERRAREREEDERGLKKGTEEEIEKLEGEMRRRWEEGRARVRELDEKRKEINRKIDEMLGLPTEFPKVQSRRRADRERKREILSRPSSHTRYPSSYRDAMLDRLWNGEKYICERYFQGPLRPDPMLHRLWDGHKYPSHLHFGLWKDPMFDRLWNGETYGTRQADPMLSRLWNGERYSLTTTSEKDSMLHRLWSDVRYSNEKDVSIMRDPMTEPLWSDRRYLHEKYISTKIDPMLSRLWNGERYCQRRPVSCQDDPMMARLWSDERYTISGLRDPMLAQLWNGERYMSSQHEEGQDPIMKRLWASTQYREDPTVTRLWAAVGHRDDPMLDRLWNGESYSTEEEAEFELSHVLWVSEPAIRSPIPRSPIRTDLYNLGSRYPSHHVSERRDSIDDEDSSIDNIVNSSQRHSGFFTAFFNSIKTDIPLVNDYLGNQEYTNVPGDDFDDFVTQPLPYHAPNEQHVHFEDILEDHSDHEDDAEVSEVSEEEEFPFRNNTSGLRIQTISLPIHASTGHADLSFETLTHFPSSGAPSSPATPSDPTSHAFQELHHGSVSSISIPTSWSPPREEVHLALGPREVKRDGTTNQFVSYMPPSSGLIAGEEVQEERERPSAKRGVSGYFNNVPQNPRLSRDLGRMFGGFKGERKEGGDEENETRNEGQALLGRLSKMAGGLYYGGSGEEKGRLLGE